MTGPKHDPTTDATAGHVTFTADDLKRMPPDPPIYWARKLMASGLWPEEPRGALVVREGAYTREFWRTGRDGSRHLEDREDLVAHHVHPHNREEYPDLDDPGTQGVLDVLLREKCTLLQIVVGGGIVSMRGATKHADHSVLGKTDDPSLRAQLLLKFDDEES